MNGVSVSTSSSEKRTGDKMPMCGNCAGGLVLLGYVGWVDIDFWSEDNHDREHAYDDFYTSDLQHSIWKCPHCHSIFLMVEA